MRAHRLQPSLSPLPFPHYAVTPLLILQNHPSNLFFSSLSALLRRQARQVQRVEAAKESELRWPVPVEEALWMVAPRLPRWVREALDVIALAPGCYRVGPSWFQWLWIAANELPLRDELVPFLVARSGRPLDEFAVWVASRRPLEWMMDMLQSLDMSDSVREDLKRRFSRKDDPVVEARRQDLLRTLLADTPEVQQELIEKGIEKGIERGIEKGIEKGIRRGRLTEARAALSRLLARRGLTLSQAQEAAIAACEDLATLEHWFDQAVTAASAEEALT